MKFSISFLALFLLLATACIDEIETRNFFAVETLPPETDAMPLGKILLRGIHLAEISELSAPSEHGFFFSTDSLAVVSKNAFQIKLSSPQFPPLPDLSIFEASSLTMEDNLTYYYSAYVRQGERLVTGRIEHYSISVDGMVNQVGARRNDTITYFLRLSGLDNTSYSAVGYYLLKINSDETADTLRGPVQLPDGPDELFNVGFPEFNTNYIILPYIDSEQRYYGTPFPVTVTDGWVEIDPFPVPVKDAEVIVQDNTAFVLFGCPSPGEDCGSIGASSMAAALTYNEGMLPTDFRWQELDLSGFIAPGFGGVTFAGPDGLYRGFGRGGLENDVISSYQRFFPTRGEVIQTESVFFDAVSFTINEHIYLGSGEQSQDQAISDRMYQLNLETGELNEVAELPFRQENQSRNQKRTEAVSFTIDDIAYAGMGKSLPYYNNDFYRFLPPSGEETMGVWEFVGQLPGDGRAEGVAFALNGKGYMGLGSNFSGRYFNDFYEFDPGSQVFRVRQSLPADGRLAAVAFGIGPYGCVCTGLRRIENEGNDGTISLGSCWLYIPSTLD